MCLFSQGDDCEYLHEYDMTKMPECYFFSKYGECSNKDCQYLHIDPNSKVGSALCLVLSRPACHICGLLDLAE